MSGCLQYICNGAVCTCDLSLSLSNPNFTVAVVAIGLSFVVAAVVLLREIFKDDI